MKKKLLLGLLVLFMVLPCFTEETYNQALNREKTIGNEWNSLVKLEKELDGESYINLENYMMGFAFGAQALYEWLNSIMAYTVFMENSEFYFNQYQNLMKYYAPETNNFRWEYFLTGYMRSASGKIRYGINDF